MFVGFLHDGLCGCGARAAGGCKTVSDFETHLHKPDAAPDDFSVELFSVIRA